MVVIVTDISIFAIAVVLPSSYTVTSNRTDRRGEKKVLRTTIVPRRRFIAVVVVARADTKWGEGNSARGR